MDKLPRSIPVKCGIYDTAYRLTCHTDGSITVKAPFIRWRGSTGTLDFESRRIDRPAIVEAVKRFFRDGNLVRLSNDGQYSLSLPELLL